MFPFLPIVHYLVCVIVNHFYFQTVDTHPLELPAHIQDFQHPFSLFSFDLIVVHHHVHHVLAQFVRLVSKLELAITWIIAFSYSLPITAVSLWDSIRLTW